MAKRKARKTKEIKPAEPIQPVNQDQPKADPQPAIPKDFILFTVYVINDKPAMKKLGIHDRLQVVALDYETAQRYVEKVLDRQVVSIHQQEPIHLAVKK